MRETIYGWIGIPVGVGIAPTKTLAKLANHAVKTYPATGGVVDLSDLGTSTPSDGTIPIEEVWGVGRQLSKHLRAIDIDTALKLADADLRWIKRSLTSC